MTSRRDLENKPKEEGEERSFKGFAEKRSK